MSAATVTFKGQITIAADVWRRLGLNREIGWSSLATALIETHRTAESPGVVGLVVLVEVIRVSESSYGASRAEVAEIVRHILSIRQLTVQDAEVVWQALGHFESSRADFADGLLQRSAKAAGCRKTVTFDKRAGMTLLR
ncbi:PIN domain-containing protein [Gemmatimonas sp.]|uniref:PIN domain-containing protein n=1 Tax=Gemmatimonas sp. TaxID=1962908 RepID=UPI0035645F78